VYSSFFVTARIVVTKVSSAGSGRTTLLSYSFGSSWRSRSAQACGTTSKWFAIRWQRAPIVSFERAANFALPAVGPAYE
jgi:hypothetical protein